MIMDFLTKAKITIVKDQSYEKISFIFRLKIYWRLEWNYICPISNVVSDNLRVSFS